MTTELTKLNEDVLSEREAEERRRLHLPVGPIRCPSCNSFRIEQVRRAA
jgi:hypothetical protein